ncbi:MAG: long-chain-fatty-acid--CoA ligase [Dehalococcoidia bacterium]|jgi:acyl-CoA synthetase (AMP-forming)/AMP-acid ligase II|nr:long-chain-fatty-acid--CoA ligase [Dehalococcoidia bacterium]
MRLHDYLQYQAGQHPDSEFALDSQRSLTYAEGAAEAHQVANALVAAGLEIGERIALLSKNSVEYATFYYGASEAGVAPVPLNYRLAPAEWAYIINDSGARALITSPEFAEAIDGLKAELTSVERYFVIGEGPDGWDDYRAWVAAQPAEQCGRTIEESNDAYQMYTSGTTGHPKGAVVQQRAICSNVEQCVVGALAFEAGERALVVAPMYHAAGAILCFSAVSGGASLLIHEDFNPPEVVRAMDEDNVAIVLLVPAMIQACLVFVPDAADRAYSDLRMVVYGASPIAADTLKQAMTTFKCSFGQGYGMTEMSAVISLLSASDHEHAVTDRPELLLSAGRAVLGAEVRIVDEDDLELPNGEVGEMIARGPQMMSGYWNLADETAAALKGGWMHTGDAGRLDDDGYIYIQDRVKDMIVSGGENVYPATVEAALFGHPAIADVAVIGIPDEQWGETVKAIVVLREGETATDEELMEFCNEKLGGFERPRSVDFIAEIPRNASGKVLKRELREPFWVGHERRVAGA